MNIFFPHSMTTRERNRLFHIDGWIGLALLFGRETLPPSSARHSSSHPLIPSSPLIAPFAAGFNMGREETLDIGVHRTGRPSGEVGGQRGNAAVNDFGVVSDKRRRRRNAEE